MRAAFFGGTFDPPHRGHLAIARAAADAFALDRILFAPAGRQPLKESAASTPFIHRYAMTTLATQADPRFTPSLIDAPRLKDGRQQPNYTAETLETLRSQLNQATLFTLLGADSWLNIARWHRAPDLLALSDWIVAARPGSDLTQPQRALPPSIQFEAASDPMHGRYLKLTHANGNSTRVFFLPQVDEDISATALREAIQSGTELDAVVPPQVAAYIHKTGLYRPTDENQPLAAATETNYDEP